MKHKDTEKFESVFSSMKGYKKAKPSKDLFERINQEINTDVSEEMFDDIFNSMKGSVKANPSEGLFQSIKNEISSKESTIILFRRPFISAAAAAAILILNVVTVIQYSQSQNMQSAETVTDIYDNTLMSSYQIYE